MRYYKDGNNVIATVGTIGLPEITAEEYESEMANAQKRAEKQAVISERTRPMTESEVTRLLISQQINTISVDDNTALRMLAFYPEWSAGQAYQSGYKVQRGGKLWRCLQEHTSQDGWEPENAASLWTEICETHDGTIDDPIPYSGNMALQNGKYYTQDGVLYLCNRDTGNPVYHPLSELVGLYVTVVENGAD